MYRARNGIAAVLVLAALLLFGPELLPAAVGTPGRARAVAETDAPLEPVTPTPASVGPAGVRAPLTPEATTPGPVKARFAAEARATVAPAAADRGNVDTTHPQRGLLQEILHESSRPAVEPFTTSYQKVSCGAIVKNLCFWNGQARFFSPGKKLLSSTGATKVCNEAGQKYKFHAGVDAPQPLSQLPPHHADTIVVAPFCWELYGYHLFLCLFSTYAHLESLGVWQWINASRGVGRRPRLAIALMKGGSFTPWQVGSRESWDDPIRKRSDSDRDATQASSFWPLWRSLTDDPALVFPLPNAPRACYPVAIVGAPPPTVADPSAAKRLRSSLLRTLGVARHRDARACRGYMTVVVQRTKNYAIRNIDAVVATLSRVVGSNVSVVTLEALPFHRQLQLALDADLWVGVHGNGLAWRSMLQPGSAAIELWPNAPYNANYHHFARRADVHLSPVRGDGQCPQRCSAGYDVAGAAAEARAHLDRVHCDGVRFDLSAEYRRERAAVAEKKLARKQERISRRDA